LTKHRRGLYPLEPFTTEECGAVIDQVEKIGNEFLKKHGTRLVFASDEFYLKAKRPIPTPEFYEGYPQLENGVGMLRSFSEEFGMCTEDLRDGITSFTPRTVSLVTGVAAYPTVKALTDRLSELCPGLKINVYKIINKFFGESITVTGLLTGKDICEQLSGCELGDELLIPKNALRAGEDVFLCDMTVDRMSEILGVKVRPAGDDGYGLAEAILNPAD
jgi:NifB/MoaA-like Fe-S oxidoreductase